jgi:hypothetical protein
MRNFAALLAAVLLLAALKFSVAYIGRSRSGKFTAARVAENEPVVPRSAAGPARARRALRLSGTLTDPATCGTQEAGDNVDTYAYVIIAEDVGYTVEPGDRLVYDVLIPAESTLNSGAVEFVDIIGAIGGNLRDSDARDQFGLYSHPATDLSKAPRKADGTPNFARGRWMTREIALTDQEGGTMNTFLLAFDEHDVTHGADQCPIVKKSAKVIAYFRDIRFVDRAGRTKKALYSGEETLAGKRKKLTETYLLTDTVTDPLVEVVDDPSPQSH